MINIRSLFFLMPIFILAIGSCACSMNNQSDSPYSKYKKVLKTSEAVMHLKMFKVKTFPCQEEACKVPKPEQIGGGTASVVRKYKSKTILISAEHVCSHVGRISLNESLDVIMKRGTLEVKFKATDIHGHEYNAKVIDLNVDDDLCLLEVDSSVDVAPIKIASKEPKRGDHVFYFGAALGIYGKDTLPEWNGFFAGKTYEKKGKKTIYRYLFTKTSVYPGASGSAILNKNGELISIASTLKVFPLYGHPQAAPDMNFGSRLSAIKKMISWIDQQYLF